MTLATHIYTLGKINGPELFEWVNQNLLKVEHPITHSKTLGHRYAHPWQEGETEVATSHQLHNRLGQGFDAIFELDWWDDPQLLTNELYGPDVDEEDVEYYTEKQEKIGAPYYAKIDFDTAYGFNRDGMGCTELHASYIVRLYREYFEPRGIDIVWQDEYTGDMWKNLDQEGMTKFLDGGDEAVDWFHNSVLPNLDKMVKPVLDNDPPSEV